MYIRESEPCGGGRTGISPHFLLQLNSFSTCCLVGTRGIFFFSFVFGVRLDLALVLALVVVVME
uniref:Uncharacterized protein n=1 Tax=Arundo donax TaxID=35708 RepID=A0A0A9GI67_ARUDO